MKIDLTSNIEIDSFYMGFSENNGEPDENEKREINTKKIDNIEFDGIDMDDYPDFCDAFVVSADMNGWPMNSEELDDLNENYREFIYEKLIDKLF
jgi:hypothetical protein